VQTEKNLDFEGHETWFLRTSFKGNRHSRLQTFYFIFLTKNVHF